MNKIIIVALLLASPVALADGYVYDQYGNAYYYDNFNSNQMSDAEMQQQIDSYRQRVQQQRRLREQSQHPNDGVYIMEDTTSGGYYEQRRARRANQNNYGY